MLTARSHPAVAGFSLIELMVVVVILAILSMLALPSYNRWIANTQVRTAAESLQNGLRQAAGEAVKRNTQVDLVLTDDADLTTPTPTALATGRSWVVRVPAIVNPPTAAELVNAKAQAEGSRNVTVTAAQLGAATPVSVVSFNGLGRLVAGAPAVQIDLTNANSDRPLRVIVSTGGRVRMCDPAFPATDPQGC